jgi:hypothetical protein
MIIKKTEAIEISCIKHHKIYYSIYKIFPSIIHFLSEIKKDERYRSATSVSVYPFLFGETSISNIVKRYPINYLFKPIMFLASILMFLYWRSNNILFNSVLGQNKYNKFYIYGFLSSFFLFFHVLFLGLEFDNSVFQLIRKLVIIFFILFEVMAQYSFVKKIYTFKNKFLDFVSLKILKIKMSLVAFILFFSTIIIFILAIYDFTKKLDYFLEWNYFIILLFFYLLSYLLWKKKIN